MQKWIGLALILGLGVHAQQANVRGKVSDGTGKAVANAIIELTKLKLKDTTGVDGTYSLVTPTSSLRGSALPLSGAMSFEKGILEMALGKPAQVKVEIFDARGNVLHHESFGEASNGVYRLDLRGKVHSNHLAIVKATVGEFVRTFQYQPSAYEGQTRISMTAITTGNGGLAKVAATVDTIKVTASGFTTKSIALSAYDTTVNVTLEAGSGDRWGGLKNAPIKSAGCGKALGTIKSGTIHISSGSRGDYILDVPTNYDPNTPYRLIFGMHCLGANAQRVAAADNGDDLSGYYSMKTLATKDNIQAIYVAMQGDAGGTWNPSGDPKFFIDVLNQLESNLCVDTTRVFVTGFSFGAMFSYALSLHYPERIRAVATYAPANWNFNPQPTNRKIPIAYYQTTGIDDRTCSWINNDAQKTGGKYCLLQHAEDNGCNTSGTIKLATKGSAHVVTEFTECKSGYPVKFSSFDGGHQATASDPGSRENWQEKEAWEFFKQF